MAIKTAFRKAIPILYLPMWSFKLDIGMSQKQTITGWIAVSSEILPFP